MLDLQAIEQIKQLKARYFRFLDTADVSGLETVFAADAVIDFKSPTYEIRCEGWPEMKAFYDQAFTETKYGMHNGHHPEIDVEGDTATGIWYLHDLFINEEEQTILQGSALYRDQYSKQGDQWRIQYSGYERMLEVIAPLPADWEIGARPTQRR